MKIIKIFLLLCVGLWAEFKLDIPNTIDVSQLENIVKNGWNDSNKSLNEFIVSNVERVMPEVLEKIKKPVLKVKPSKSEPFPVPKLLLHRYDYWLIVSYCRYLEYSGENNEALNLYVKMLNGFNEIVDKSMLSVIFRMTTESMVVTRITYGVKNEYYSESIKVDLKNKLENKLLLDYDTYFISIEKEKQFVLDATHLSFFDKAEEESIGYNNLMNAAYKSLKNHIDKYFLKMTNALQISMKNNNNIAVNDFGKYMENEKEEHITVINNIHFFLSSVLVKIRSLLKLGGQDKSYTTEYMGKTTALVAMPLIKSTYLDYVDFIEKNKNLLKDLE